MASRAQPALWRETVKAGAVRSGALIASVAIFVATVAMVLALASYHASDPALNTASGGNPANLIGPPGAWFADIALSVFGPAVALLLPVGPIVGMRLWRDLPAGHWGRMLRNTALGVALMASALAFVSDSSVLALPAGWGGIVGLAVANTTEWALAFIGQPVAELWSARAIGLLLGVAGAIVWGRSLEIELGERNWRFRRAGRADPDHARGEGRVDPRPARDRMRGSA